MAGSKVGVDLLGSHSTVKFWNIFAMNKNTVSLANVSPKHWRRPVITK